MTSTENLTERPDLFVGGEWVRPGDGGLLDVIEPATEEVMGRVAVATASDVDGAVAAARAALAGPWGHTSPEERADFLERFADALQRRGRDTAVLVSRENGTPISLSKGTNGFAPAAICRYYAGLVRDLLVEEVREGARGASVVRRGPVGVVAAVTPWNYPQSLAIMKIAPALAAGCTVVLKPPLETALDAFVFAEAALEAGLPPGVLNVLPGGRDVGAELVAHPGLDKVAFTGSTAAGISIAETCGRLLRPVTLELGGKSAGIVLPSADLDAFQADLATTTFVNSGQTCTVSSRILAPRSRYADVVAAVTAAAEDLVIGDPLDRNTEIGPLVSKAQQTRVQGFIDRARDTGRLTTGGGVPPAQTRGWYVQPTVFADVDNGSEIAQEEIFGPVAVVIPYEDVDDAVAIANDSRYGLAGTVWAAEVEEGLQVARRMKTGSVGVNHFSLHLEAPFGGLKASGIGKELGPEGLLPYLQLTSVYTAPGVTPRPATR